MDVKTKETYWTNLSSQKLKINSAKKGYIYRCNRLYRLYRFFFTGMAGRPPVKKSEKRTTRRKLKLLTSGAMVSARETRTALALLFAPLVKAGDPVVPCIFLAGCPMVTDPYPDPRQPLTFQFMSNYWACFLPVVRRVSE